MTVIISKTSYEVVYDSNEEIMAKRSGNNYMAIDDSSMESMRSWQNWLNEADYLENIGVVSICDCPFATHNDPELVKEDVFNQKS